MKNKIPDRWLDYSPMGTKVAGTRFIAFKAPLTKEICSRMKPTERFTPEILMERCPNMRLIIDLTNTDRYYNKQEFIDRGIQYEKIMCPGQVIPPQSLIFRFFEIIDDFYLKNGLKDVLIGIHCTHGVNRTGYFIGRYMVQRMGFHYEKAIPCIEDARGHKIERMNYIKDLTVQVPIPSSLSSSSSKKVVDTKPDRKGSVYQGRAAGKVSRDRTPERHYAKRPPPEYRQPPARSPEPPVRCVPGPPPPRHSSPPQSRHTSPPRRPPSPPRRRAPSPRRARTPPRSFSPRRRTPPPRRSPPRRMSPPRREPDLPPYRGDDYPSRSAPSRRSFSPPRKPEPNFPPRGPPEGPKNYGPPSFAPWQPPHDRGFNSSGPPSSNYRPPDSRPSDRYSGWESRPSGPPPRPPHAPSGPPHWNNPPQNNFSSPPFNTSVPPPGFHSRSGPPPSTSRFDDRRFEEPPPPPRDRHWSDNNGSSYNSGRFEEGRFTERGGDYRGRNEDKPYRSPPRDYPREKRPPSPMREYSRGFDSGRSEPSWDARRRSPEQYGEGRGGMRRRSRSPGRRAPSPRRSRSPRRRSPPPREPQRRPSPRRREPSPHRGAPPPPFEPRPDRFSTSRDDCRDLLNQKRHYDGPEFYPPKVDLREVPKEVDLRKVIRGANSPPLKDRLGPPPREEPPSRYPPHRAPRSPRPRSPPRFPPQRRY